MASSLTFFAQIVSAHAWNVVTTFTCILILAVLANVLQQTLLRNQNEPPVVFHWLPIIGSTVTYGIDPFKFFFRCQATVRNRDPQISLESSVRER